MTDVEISELTTKTLMEARLIRIVRAAVITNLEHETIYGRRGEQTVDLELAGDSSRLKMSDFVDEDFKVSIGIIRQRAR